MLCDNCSEREATIHEVVIKSGQSIQKHLCEQCAKGAGIESQPHIPINDLIHKFVVSSTGPNPGAKIATRGVTCPSCALSYSEFKQTGLLGCAECYRKFETLLGPLLERAHDGGCHHVGKIPRRALSSGRQSGESGRLDSLLGGAQQRSERLTTVRKHLADAVDAEQYERAAKLRDEIRRLTEIQGSNAPHPAPHPESHPESHAKDDA